MALWHIHIIKDHSGNEKKPTAATLYAPFQIELFDFSFHPVLHKGHGMYYPVYGMVHIKEPLLLIGKNSPCGGSGFPLSLSEWSFTICPMPYNRK